MFAQPVHEPSKHTLRPTVTGTSAIGIKYKGGVMVATDTIACYGSWIRYKDVERIHQVSKDTLLAMNGEMSDYQKILQMLEQKRVHEYCMDDGSTQTSAELHSYLTRVMYQKRCKMDPLWNMLLVAGYRDGEAYLGYTDLYGSSFTDDYLATGLGMYMALPLMRNQWSPEMTEAQARALLESALKICYYRDTRASNKVQIARVDESGVHIDEPITLQGEWNHQRFVDGSAKAGDGGW
mmetsp:Transcript_21824/g.64398  ORF Transcript_21824/g.64398 Transcript_21824/m.64398 type:complete len:237 (+) Transcript_21824:40-750(+)|eukprot:CAMPEP_0206032654 /NCGR_PEP_ID=MMETSP1466-20131121/87_1 /ASSEMBLY_ACC=CAM_ASM_001126 /TAXON_ID=44452 /ORGANISM="Pavlova gyrans, Strain CCMP608" /LENGTH=236 /DNA_ID=CAMNT_0053406789 /DNA_START=29 /DNA_END=739 /DNA_ORIENTATION=+